MSNPSIVELKPFLQPFPYGREGEASRAARFAKEVIPDTKIDPKQPYGEIWLGSTHQNGPCEVLSTGQKLKDLVQSAPEFYLGKKLLGNKSMQQLYKNDLPFLFKILSFDKALPLQAHPDPSLGSKLKDQEKGEKGQNEDFVDRNGKPEVSVALTDFTAFVGFRPPSHIAAFLDEVPEFANVFSEPERSQLKKAAESGDKTHTQANKDALKSLFGTLIGMAEGKVKALVLTLTEKLDAKGPKAIFGSSKDAEELAKVWKKNLKTYGESDIGIVVTAYLMNLVQLPPGEGCWILADDIHAYVEGDVIECMANSDNMVCHGLGESDQGGRSTFVNMLSYRHLPASKLLLEYEDGWNGQQGNTRLYKVPIDEFDLVRVALSESSKTETLTLPGPHTFTVTEGTIKARAGGVEVTLRTGHTAFVRADVELSLELVAGEKGELWGSFYQ